MSFNIFSLLPSIISLIKVIPQIREAWDSSATNSIGKVQAVIKDTDLIPTLEALGSELFPDLSPTIHAAAAALVVAHPNSTSWLQSALNVIQSSGYISFGAPLAVDGYYGPKTTAALKALQTKVGLPVTGFAADLEYKAIQALLGRID